MYSFSARPDKNRRLHDKIFTEKLKSTLKEYTQKKARMLAKKKYIRSYDHNSATGKSQIDVESLGQSYQANDDLHRER